MDNKESKLSIVTTENGTKSTVDILGTPKEHLFNLTLLTRDVAKAIGVPPVVLPHILPSLIRDYEQRGMVSATIIDIGAIQKGGGIT